MNKLYIENQTNFKFNYKFIFQKIINLICQAEKIQDKTEVNLIIVSSNDIKKIAHQYQNKNKATDTLSFPTNYKNLFDILGYNMLGDIYISYEKIIKQAQEYNHSPKREWTYIFTHSVYHLLGFNHINNKQEEDIMNRKVKKIMKKIKVGRND